MAQLSPTNLIYAQAAAFLEKFKEEYAAGELKTIDQITEGIKEITSKYGLEVGRPLAKFDPFQKGEPAVSEKMNRFTRDVQHDVNILEDQVDLLRASSIFMYNYVTTEILRLRNENARAANKVKTLQLYSSSNDINIITSGDYFVNEEFIDYDLVSQSERTSLITPGALTLGRDTESIDVIADATVKILPTSNGFPGNNQEILDPSSTPINSTTSVVEYTFAAELDRHADTDNIIDGKPNTWFEYEKNYVLPDDRIKARNFNFVYEKTNATQDEPNTVNWADGPNGGALKLNLEFDLGEIKIINNVAYTPFGISNNANPPVRVNSVQISNNSTDWIVINPQNVWIGTDANLQSASVSDNVTIGTAVWTFDERAVRYIRLYLEQTRSIKSNIGHLYYESGLSTSTQPDRIEGPIPTLEELSTFYSPANSTHGYIIRRTEYFVGDRWAIGIRDCAINEVRYKETSVLVSKKFRINGVVDRVALEANTFVPANFSADSLWIRFYISPDDGINWFPISRIQDDFLGIPEILAFNDPLPADFQENGVGYHSVPGTVTSLRLKIELSRPPDAKSSSPIVRNYKIKVRRR